MIEIIIPGTPKPWKAPTYSRFGAFSSQTKHKKAMAMLIKRKWKEPMITQACRVDITFYMPIPNSASAEIREILQKELTPHVTKCDLTNMRKLAEDALELAGVVSNDSIIYLGWTEKYYGKTPRTVITIYNMESAMPLVKSSSKKAVGKNIKKEVEAGKPQRQAVAIALETQRRAKRGKK